MRQLGRGVLLGLAIAGLAAVLFQFAWTVYGILDNTPIDYIWGTLFILIVCAWVYYAKWLWSQWRRVRRERKKDQWFNDPNATAIQRAARQELAGRVPMGTAVGVAAMQEKEQETQDWSLKGSDPGSVGAAIVGLEVADEYLEGDM